MHDAPGPAAENPEGTLRDDVAALTRRVVELERQLAALQITRSADTASPAPPPRPSFSAATPGVPEAHGALPPAAASGLPPHALPSPPLAAGTSSGSAPIQQLPRSPTRFASSLRSRPDLESRIGSQIFSRVGILALLLAAAWFLKLSIARGWIGPTGRILIGLLAGAALVLWSERFRRQGFAIFSYSLKAIGSGVLYLALWAAFQLYHLLPAAVALGAMILVTAWNGWMAWAQDAELLGGYALAGAMATPALLSTGGDHEIFLFTYLLAIDLLCALLVRLKGWVRLLPWVFVSTVSYFIGWYSAHYIPSALALTSTFIVLIFAAFQIPVFAAALQTPSEAAPVTPPSAFRRALGWSSVTSVLLPFADAAFLSLAMYSVLEDAHHHSWLAWLMVVLAALYLALMRLPQPAVTAGVHLSLAVVFLTVAIPLKATGHWITMAWLVEGVALLAIALRTTAPLSQSRLLRALASAALLLGWLGALFRVLDGYTQTAFWNARFATALVGLAALAAAVWLCRRVPQREPHTASPAPRHIAALSVIGFNILAIAAGVYEITLHWSRHLPADPSAPFKRSLAVSTFLMLYGAALLAAGFWKRTAFLRWQGLLLVALTIIKIFLLDTRALGEAYRIASFFGLGVLLVGISFVYQRDLLSLRSPAPAPPAGAEPAQAHPAEGHRA